MMGAFLMKPEYFGIESDFLYNLNNHNIENNFLLPIYEGLRYGFNFLEGGNYKENNFLYGVGKTNFTESIFDIVYNKEHI
ncbi:hypothetical protein HXK64_00325 [Candidatus Gracilibacteria bacterium]|nr:hypothetical protein [Candidatus Gracilibacteria bacterium]